MIANYSFGIRDPWTRLGRLLVARRKEQGRRDEVSICEERGKLKDTKGHEYQNSDGIEGDSLGWVLGGAIFIYLLRLVTLTIFISWGFYSAVSAPNGQVFLEWTMLASAADESDVVYTY